MASSRSRATLARSRRIRAAAVTVNNALIRFGGITVSTGGVNGQIVALGNVFGDIRSSGRIERADRRERQERGVSASAVAAMASWAMSRSTGASHTGAIVSAGLLGDNTGGTQLSIFGSDQGHPRRRGRYQLLRQYQQFDECVSKPLASTRPPSMPSSPTAAASHHSERVDPDPSGSGCPYREKPQPDRHGFLEDDRACLRILIRRHAFCKCSPVVTRPRSHPLRGSPRLASGHPPLSSPSIELWV